MSREHERDGRAGCDDPTAHDPFARLHCTMLADTGSTTARVTRVLVTGAGQHLGATVLAMFPDHDVSLLCSPDELQRLERDVRLLLLELAAEDELELLDQRALSRVAPLADGRCRVCVDGPEESCTVYDEVVVCGRDVLRCRS